MLSCCFWLLNPSPPCSCCRLEPSVTVLLPIDTFIVPLLTASHHAARLHLLVDLLFSLSHALVGWYSYAVGALHIVDFQSSTLHCHHTSLSVGYSLLPRLLPPSCHQSVDQAAMAGETVNPKEYGQLLKTQANITQTAMAGETMQSLQINMDRA